MTHCLRALLVSVGIVSACAGRPVPAMAPATASVTAAPATSPATVAQPPASPSPLASPTAASATPRPSDAPEEPAPSPPITPTEQVAGGVRGVPRYARDAWQHWVDADGDCQDTRTEVLIAESLVPVTFEDPGHCSVKTGRWRCPYTGAVFTDPAQLDIDHLVPLKNAHTSGGWAWTAEQRRAFANDLGEPDQLVVVSRRANRSKSVHTPDEWMPPEPSARCWYVAAWARAKARWRLQMAAAERAFVQQVAAECGGGTGVAAPVESETDGADPARARPLLCRDGTLSPSCTCGGPRRGCCSHHGGVAACAP